MGGENIQRQPDHSEGVELEDILNRCKDAQGYVLMVGIITPEIDASGFNVIQMRYRRFHYSFEDTKNVIEKFKEEYEKDKDASL